MESIATVHPEATQVDNPDEMLKVAQEVHADLVVIGPEIPLVAGVADTLRAHGFAVFGPNKNAARIEGSKAFAKDVMAKAGVKTARAEQIVPVPRMPSGKLPWIILVRITWSKMTALLVAKALW